MKDLKTEEIIRISRSDLRNAFNEIDEQLRLAGVNLEASQVADTTLTALALVSAGDGISLVPSWAATLPCKGVSFRHVSDLTARIDLAVIWEAANLPSIAHHFIEVARRIAK